MVSRFRIFERVPERSSTVFDYEEIVMHESQVTADQWVDMLRTIGLDDAQMEAWHADFERRHPGAHESFLRWLNLPTECIGDIRGRAAVRS